jgi:hypothetical protein
MRKMGIAGRWFAMYEDGRREKREDRRGRGFYFILG